MSDRTPPHLFPTLERHRKVTLIALGLVYGALAAAFIYTHHMMTQGALEGYVPLTFERGAWLANEHTVSDQYQDRILMIDDLLANHDFMGWSRDQIVDLLGEPTDRSYFQEFELVYRLGNERAWMSIDSEWLAFRLGDSGTVTEYRLMRD